MNEQKPKIEGQPCPDCGQGTIVRNPKTQKLFCDKKCWLNRTPENFQPAQSKNNNKSKSDIKCMILAYAKDIAVANINAKNETTISKMLGDANRMIAWYKGEKQQPVQQKFDNPNEKPLPGTDDGIPF